MSTVIAINRVTVLPAERRRTDLVSSTDILRRLALCIAAFALTRALSSTAAAQSAPVLSLQPISQSQTGIRALGSGSSDAYHTVALRADGQIWEWGYNFAGELGDGTTTTRSVATLALGLSDVVAVSPGAAHNIALTTAGTVYTWGFNGYGGLGDGTTVNRLLPAQVSGISNVVAVAAGDGHSLVLKSDGTVWGWGWNQYGQLGDGTTTDRPTPQQINGLSGVVALACGEYHNLALKSDGTVWVWGYNNYGQLGDGTTVTRLAAYQLPGLSGVTAIACGCNHSLVLKSDGTIRAWGRNNYGQLGDGTTTDRPSAVVVNGLANVTSIAGNNFISAALKSDQTVWTWGDSSEGKLGDPYRVNPLIPGQVPGLTNVTALVCGQNHTAVLKSDGTVWTWGANWYGELGDGTYSNRSSPQMVVYLSDCLFNVAASGSPAPTYKWQRKPAGQSTFVDLSEGSTYIGVTSSSLRVRNPTTTMNGDQFQCVVTNAAGSVTSNAATLGIGPPTMSILGGNNQSAYAGSFNPQPFDVAAWTSAGTAPLMSTPVTFTVQSGGGSLATTNTGSPTLYSSITLNTDYLGTAQLYYLQPTTAGVTSQIVASSGGSQVVFTTQSLTPPPVPNPPAWAKTSSTKPNQIIISWGAASAAIGGSPLAGYNVYRNGVKLNSAPLLGQSYTDTTVTAGASYTYVVKAVDTLGKESSPLTLNVTTPASSTAGSFEVFTPAP